MGCYHHPHLIAGESRLNSKLKSEGEDTKGKKAKEGTGNQDVDADVGQQKEVGEDEDADNSSETAQLSDLNNFTSFLAREHSDLREFQKSKPVPGPQIEQCLLLPQG